MTNATKPAAVSHAAGFDSPTSSSAYLEERTLRLPGVTITFNDPAAVEQIRSHAANIYSDAVALQGPRALECTLSSAKFHEAGHAVVYAHFGRAVLSCKIWQIQDGPEAGQWVGKTGSDQGYKVDATTTPEHDFKEACCVYAGVLAEFHFDKDFRMGSSADEIIAAKIIAHTVAEKTGQQPADVILEVLWVTTQTLKRNADVVRAFARDLERHGAVRKRRLEELLERVSQRANRGGSISRLVSACRKHEKTGEYSDELKKALDTLAIAHAAVAFEKFSGPLEW
jgi:hypothetical protein